MISIRLIGIVCLFVFFAIVGPVVYLWFFSPDSSAFTGLSAVEESHSAIADTPMVIVNNYPNTEPETTVDHTNEEQLELEPSNVGTLSARQEIVESQSIGDEDLSASWLEENQQPINQPTTYVDATPLPFTEQGSNDLIPFIEFSVHPRTVRGDLQSALALSLSIETVGVAKAMLETLIDDMAHDEVYFPIATLIQDSLDSMTMVDAQHAQFVQKQIQTWSHIQSTAILQSKSGLETESTPIEDQVPMDESLGEQVLNYLDSVYVVERDVQVAAYSTEAIQSKWVQDLLNRISHSIERVNADSFDISLEQLKQVGATKPEILAEYGIGSNELNDLAKVQLDVKRENLIRAIEMAVALEPK